MWDTHRARARGGVLALDHSLIKYERKAPAMCANCYSLPERGGELSAASWPQNGGGGGGGTATRR